MNNKQHKKITNRYVAPLYFAVAIIALLVTWYFNIQFLVQGGSIMPAVFFGAAFANPLTTSITLDVIFAAIVFSIWVVSESKRLGLRRSWVYIVLCFAVALAVAFPLFLGIRALKLQRQDD